MKFELKKRILAHKTFFDVGLGLTSYVKYFIAFFGLASQDVKNTMIIAVAYGISCYFLGRWYWINSWRKAQQELDNEQNLFVHQVRKSLNRKTK